MPKKKKYPAKPGRFGRVVEGLVCVIYARYSSHNQKDISIEQQVEKCTHLAESYGIKVVDVYADRAISGRTDKRAAFQRMMHDASNGKFHYVVSWKSSRIGRNMLEALINEETLQNYGVRVLYVEEDFDDTAAGRFAARQMMSMNQFYSENLAEDVVRGMYSNAKNCLVNGRAPYGYKSDEAGHYVIDENRSAVVQEIFSRVSCGEPFVDIANSLNARGITTANGRPWGKSSFRSILGNERYRGIYIYDEIRIEGGMPRMISDELFFKAQEVLSVKKAVKGRHSPNGDYLLTGKLFCGHCKSPMTGMSGTAKSGAVHYYYNCQKKATGKGCDKKNVRKDEIEQSVARAIQQYALTDESIAWIVDQTIAYSKQQEKESGIGQLEDQLASVKASLRNIMKAIEMGIVTETTKERLMELEHERTGVEGKIAAAKANIIPVEREQLVTWLMSLRNRDITDKKCQRELFNTFLQSVYLYDEEDAPKIKIVFSFSGPYKEVETPIDASVLDNVENMAFGSFKVCNGVPRKSGLPKQAAFSWVPLRSVAPPDLISFADGRNESALRKFSAAFGGSEFTPHSRRGPEGPYRAYSPILGK